jgi:hypothetical protein
MDFRPCSLFRVVIRFFLTIYGQVIEGVLTIALGILIFFFVADFPDRNQFLTQRETEFILQRIEDDRGDSVPDRLPVKKVLGHLLDWKMWVFGMSDCSAWFVNAGFDKIAQD